MNITQCQINKCLSRDGVLNTVCMCVRERQLLCLAFISLSTKMVKKDNVATMQHTTTVWQIYFNIVAKQAIF